MAEVQLELQDGVALLTLCAPERRNALTHAMAAELIEACERIDADESVGAVVVRGSGGLFCAGAHRDVLARAGEDPATDEHFHGVEIVYRSFVRVGALEPPSIAAVIGGAVGAGVNLAYATDLRIVARDATIAAGFLRIGLHPGGGHFALSAALAGREATMAASVFGEALSGERAAQVGIAWEALDPTRSSRARSSWPPGRRRPGPGAPHGGSARQELGPPARPVAGRPRRRARAADVVAAAPVLSAGLATRRRCRR